MKVDLFTWPLTEFQIDSKTPPVVVCGGLETFFLHNLLDKENRAFLGLDSS